MTGHANAAFRDSSWRRRDGGQTQRSPGVERPARIESRALSEWGFQLSGHDAPDCRRYRSAASCLRGPAARCDGLPSRGPRDSAERTRRVSRVSDHRGHAHAIDADYCACALPLPVLADLKTDFSPDFRWAIGDVKYAAAGKIGMQFKRRFWEQDEGIYGGITRTDQIAQIIYPSSGFHHRNGIVIGYYIMGGENGRTMGERTRAERQELALEQGAPDPSAISGRIRNGVLRGVAPRAVEPRQLVEILLERLPNSGRARRPRIPGGRSRVAHDNAQDDRGVVGIAPPPPQKTRGQGSGVLCGVTFQRHRRSGRRIRIEPLPASSRPLSSALLVPAVNAAKVTAAIPARRDAFIGRPRGSVERITQIAPIVSGKQRGG